MLAPTLPVPLRDPNVRLDPTRANARILAGEERVDFRRVEAASLKMPARFTSAEGKRLFMRFFATLQLNTHFISVVARTRLQGAEIARVEAGLRERLESVTLHLDQAIDAVEAKFEQHGIREVATYDVRALDLEVGVMSANGRRYLEAMMKLDQLMPMLQTLEIHEVMTAEEVDLQRNAAKKQVRAVAQLTRHLAGELRRRFDRALRQATALVIEPADADEASPASEPATVVAEDDGEGTPPDQPPAPPASA